MATPNPSVGNVVATTLENRAGELADNVTNHNALLRFLNKAGNVKKTDGGYILQEHLEYGEGNFQYFSGAEAFSIADNQMFTSAEFPWKNAVATVTIKGEEERMNSGREKVIDLTQSKLKNAEKTLKNNLSIGIYSDGTGSSGKQITGLQLAVADDPTTGTYGGIDRSSWSFWRNSTYDFSTESVTASATTIQSAMNTAWLRVVRGMDKPTIIVFGTTYYSYFWNSLQAIQRITTAENANSGYKSLEWNGPGGSCPVFHDDAVSATRGYFLNTDYLFWRVHPDANMTPLKRRESINQDASVIPIIFMGNLTCNNSSLQLVMKP